MIACCPACGQHIINIVRTKWLNGRPVHPLTCTNSNCPRPLAALELLTQAAETKHVVIFDGEGFQLKHPLIERLEDKLFDCEVHRYLREHGEQHYDQRDMVRDTPYRIWLDPTDTSSFGPLQWIETESTTETQES